MREVKGDVRRGVEKWCGGKCVGVCRIFKGKCGSVCGLSVRKCVRVWESVWSECEGCGEIKV